MKRKGFTLIELLAVIVILAIIALIATPIVMNMIENAKKGAAERSAENYIDAVETAVGTERIDGNILEGEYTIQSDGSLCPDGVDCEADPNKLIKIDMSGNTPSSGTIIIENGLVVDKLSTDTSKKTTMEVEEYTVSYDSATKQLIVKKEETGGNAVACSPVVAGKTAKGDEIVCGNEHFNVITNDGNTIQMLAAKNINVTGSGDVKQIDNAGTILFVKGTNCSSYGCECDYYWQDSSGNLKEGYTTDTYGNAFVYSEENEIIQPYLNEYKEYLKDTVNLEVSKITLLSLEQALNVTDMDTTSGEIKGPNWLYSTESYLGSVSYNFHFSIGNNNAIYGHTLSPDSYIYECAPSDEGNGVRPLVIIDADQVA